MSVELATDQKITIKAAANDWISRQLPDERRHIIHSTPEYDYISNAWVINLTAKTAEGALHTVGHLVIDAQGQVVESQRPRDIALAVEGVVQRIERETSHETPLSLVGAGFEFHMGDGIEAARNLRSKSIDLLLTDPPYGISTAYTCERQVPRRIRKNGADFIMPRGNFGEWDGPIQPQEWTAAVLPAVRGWAVIFCAQAQIGEYSDILRAHRFNSVGTLVWHKTNPVPFNHRFKPINAWEALVVGKRPGTPFNGHVVHNVFRCKSPSPQERIHSTQKPLALVQEFVDLFSAEGDIVFDPFAGSGTTLIAACRSGRQAIGYELDESIYRLAHGRLTSELL